MAVDYQGSARIIVWTTPSTLLNNNTANQTAPIQRSFPRQLLEYAGTTLGGWLGARGGSKAESGDGGGAAVLTNNDDDDDASGASSSDDDDAHNTQHVESGGAKPGAPGMTGALSGVVGYIAPMFTRRTAAQPPVAVAAEDEGSEGPIDKVNLATLLFHLGASCETEEACLQVIARTLPGRFSFPCVGLIALLSHVDTPLGRKQTILASYPCITDKHNFFDLVLRSGVCDPEECGDIVRELEHRGLLLDSVHSPQPAVVALQGDQFQKVVPSTSLLGQLPSLGALAGWWARPQGTPSLTLNKHSGTKHNNNSSNHAVAVEAEDDDGDDGGGPRIVTHNDFAFSLAEDSAADHQADVWDNLHAQECDDDGLGRL